MKPRGATRLAPSWRAILQLLKQQGARDAGSLAVQLGITAMAVRQHLYALSAKGLVTYQLQPRPLGRPAKMWCLTLAAAAHFPDTHAELAVKLLNAAQQAFGAPGVKRMVAGCARRQLADYRARLPQRLQLRSPLRLRVEALVAIRNEDGFMAEVRCQPDGSFELIQNHCPIAAAAGACERLCHAELEVFRGVLGKGVAIKRTEHMMAGTRRCVYHLRQGG